MTKLFAFRGSAFNQNGDLGNLRVFKRALVGRGVSPVINDEASTEAALLGADFLVIGDASFACQRTYALEFETLPTIIAQRRSQGKATLLVGSSYERLSDSVFGLHATTRLERLSEFASVNFGSETFWGYMNTSVELPALTVDGLTIGTQFFGPVLARNPELLRILAKGLGLELDEEYLAQLDVLMKSSDNYRQALANLVS